MRYWMGSFLIVCVSAGCVAAQPAPAAAPAAASATAPSAASPSSKTLGVDSPIDDVLDALDVRGKDMSDFDANVTLTDTDIAMGADSMLVGKISMQRLAGGDARLRVTFDTKIVNDKKKAEKTEYLLSKGWLFDRNYVDHREVRRQVLKPGQKMDLLKLGEGPFPLPLGQDKADVHRLFEVAKIAPGKDDPAGTIHVQLKPKAGTQFEPRFKTIDFWVDPTSRFPTRIVTVDPNETTTRTTELKEIKVNANLADKDFELAPISDKEWTIREQPFED